MGVVDVLDGALHRAGCMRVVGMRGERIIVLGVRASQEFVHRSAESQYDHSLIDFGAAMAA